MNSVPRKKDRNPDPITREPGAHPIGTGAGAAAGGVAGAAAGAVAGPVGMAVGATIGAIAGGLAGKAAGEAVNPTAEDAYWRGQYQYEPYFAKTHTFDDYAPAYRTGYEAHGRYPGKSLDEIDGDLERDYSRNRGSSKLSWNDAKKATHAAWNRIARS